ncbi:MAG: hypothetical protein WCH05_04205 [Chlorobiaceae bacterium]
MNLLEFIGDILHTAEKQYGISPLIFGSLYFGSIPLLMVSLAWLVRNLRLKKPAILPGMLSALFFIASYLYLIIAGKNIPAEIYFLIGLLVTGGVTSAVMTTRHRMAERKDKPKEK